MKKLIQRGAWMAVLATAMPLGVMSAHAQVYVGPRIAPPPPIVERHGPPPRPGYAWIPGYHRWDGRRYVWVGGRWDRPPRPRAFWVEGHWVPGPRGYQWIPGHWRY